VGDSKSSTERVCTGSLLSRPAAASIGARSRRARHLVVITAFLLLSAVDIAGADPSERISLEIIVAHLSPEPGKNDPRAARLHAELKEQFRYESISVLDTKRLNLGIDQVGTHALPGGRKLLVKPLLIEGKSSLLSIDITGLVQTDLRIERGQLVIIGAEKYEGGKLVIALEPGP
jgi:hypothetical protein